MSNIGPQFTLHLNDGTKLLFAPQASLLTYEDGTKIDLSSVDGMYNEPGHFEEVTPISPTMPGKKVREMKLIKIQLGLKCNYSCSYCSQAFHRNTDTDKPLGKIDAFIEKLTSVLTGYAEGGADLRFEFWGGEPFVYWRTFKPLAEKIRALFPKAVLSTVTNGSLLDEEKVEWLDTMGFGVGLSHDGPGYHVRGKDPLDDPKQLEIIKLLHRKLRPQGRINFNCVLTLGNHSLKAILDHLCRKMDDNTVVLSTEGIVSIYEPAVEFLMPKTEDDHRVMRRQIYADSKEDGVVYRCNVMYSTIKQFIVGLQNERPAMANWQKCGMDKPDSIAMDLDGNLLTCQNTSSLTEHKIGTLDDIDNAQLTTSKHWSQHENCQNCPVVQMCRGSCMYLDGKDRWPTCNGHFTFYVAMLAAAIGSMTGKDLVAIEGDRVRLKGLTRFEF